MPVVVKKVGKRRYVIVEPGTGKVKGHSTSRRNAEISAWKRNKAWKAKQARRGRKP